jgi:hypothetical protein
VHGDDTDAIVEYDNTTEVSSYVLVDMYTHADTSPFLYFTDKQITGISIIDNFLFWTDGNGEPKRVNLTTSKHASNPQSSNHHSKLYVEGVDLGYLAEDHITVIKKKPHHAPLITTTSSVDTPGNSIFKKIFPRFCYRYKYRDGEFSAFSPFTDVVFKPGYTSGYNSFNAYDTKEPYNTAMLNYISSVKVSGFNRPDTPKDVVQVDILYKQENSNIIYSIASIKKTDPQWDIEGNLSLHAVSLAYSATIKGSYNITTENIHAALPESQLLRPWDNVPKKALAQDVSGNRIVYGNYTQGYDISDTPSVHTSLSYRPDSLTKIGVFHNYPTPSIKSQRDYQVGVVFGDKYGRETPVFTSEAASKSVPWHGDFIGIDNSSSDYSASNSLAFQTRLTSPLPSWADYYKFYIKHTSGEYYNLIMDRAYLPYTHSEFKNDDIHIWLSFASTDRNKLSDEDHIIMKKALSDGGSNQQVTEENKYKILDIKNEAPESIANKFYSMGAFGNDSNSILTDGTSGIFPADPNVNNERQRVDQMVDTIRINKANWLAQINSNTPIGNGSSLTSTESGADNYTESVKDLYMSWSNKGTYSEKYKISTVRVEADVYVIKLGKTITEHDALLAGTDGVGLDINGLITANSSLNHDLVFRIERKEAWANENFSGKFFVKIVADALAMTNVVGENVDITQAANVVGSARTFFWADKTVNAASNMSDGVVNSTNMGLIYSSYYGGVNSTPATIHSGNNLTNTQSEWNTLLLDAGGAGDAGTSRGGLFIDAMYFAGGNASADANNESFARESGQTILGNGNLNYPTMIWDYGWTISGGGSGVASISDWGTAAENLISRVSGLEGIITTTTPHVAGGGFGHKRWVSGTLYHANRAIETDLTYDAQGKYYMHISFPECGGNLHNGVIPDDATLDGTNGIAKYLQGIWGGGCFTKDDGSNFGGSDKSFVYMEDHIATQTLMIPGGQASDATLPGDHMPVPPGEGVVMTSGEWLTAVSTLNSTNDDVASESLGYDSAYLSDHNGQWNPTWSTPNSALDTFLNKLNTPLSKFRFSDDANNTIYKILNVTKKHIYNHTPWRASYTWDGSSWILKGDSVEEAVVAWANTATDTNLPNNTGAEFTTMTEKLQDFGRTNNRRVCYIIELDQNPLVNDYNPMAGGATVLSQNLPDIDSYTNMEFVTPNAEVLTTEVTRNPMIWETEPNQTTELDIYYEASNAIPVNLTDETQELFAPRGCRVKFPGFTASEQGQDPVFLSQWGTNGAIATTWATNVDKGFNYYDPGNPTVPLNYIGKEIRFYREDGSFTSGTVTEANMPATAATDPPDYYLTYGAYGQIRNFKFELDASKNTGLSWYNCFTHENGIESNRIRDDFNEMTITNGARVSATLEEPYAEEHRKYGLIYSGIYNSNSGVNNLNQFIQALKITKDLNPTYGSIQKLFSRSTDLVVLCEDRVIKILANKDAVYNADGNPQLIASPNVLGQSTPFVGDYGISTNPESFASESYRAYFTDSQRGAVLRLSMDGLTPISDAGMRSYFRDALGETQASYLGSYDNYKKQYNLTIKDTTTISFSEDVRGWTSFKSFIPESGVSLNSQYYTMKNGELFQHYTNDARNSFYEITNFGTVEESLPSSVNVILNQSPSTVKSFKTLNYEGSQGFVAMYGTDEASGITDLDIYNAYGIPGWQVESVITDLQQGSVNEFIKKEGKWFNYIKGQNNPITTSEQIANLSFQGLGSVNQTFDTVSDYEDAQAM